MTITLHNTESLSATAQFALITDVQNVPTTVEIREDGSEWVIYGVTPASEAAGEQLVAAFWPAIHAAARKTKLKGEGAREEAEAVALEAFVRAVREFDLTADTPFHHTITTRLARAVKLNDREESSAVTIPAVQVARYHRAMHANGLDAEAAFLDCEADPAKWDLSGTAFAGVHYAINTSPIDAPRTADGGVLDFTAEATVSHEDEIITREYARWLLAQTTDRQSQICRLAYGFTDRDTESLSVSAGYRPGDVLEDLQVADVLDMARSTVNRERRTALTTMREAAEKSLAGE